MKSANPAIIRLAPFVDLIADAFGPACEVVLHDFSNPDGSIIKIRNGHVTGRAVGGTVSEEFLELFHKMDRQPNPPVLHSVVSSMKDGRSLKGSCFIIRKKGKTIGLLSINIDLTPLHSILNLVNGIVGISPSVGGRGGARAKLKETFAPNFQVLMQDVIGKTLTETGISPNVMTKADKTRLLRELDSQGFFLIRGAVREISKRLRMSQPAIYKYLAEQREASAPVNKRAGAAPDRQQPSVSPVSANDVAFSQPI